MAVPTLFSHKRKHERFRPPEDISLHGGLAGCGFCHGRLELDVQHYELRIVPETRQVQLCHMRVEKMRLSDTTRRERPQICVRHDEPTLFLRFGIRDLPWCVVTKDVSFLRLLRYAVQRNGALWPDTPNYDKRLERRGDSWRSSTSVQCPQRETRSRRVPSPVDKQTPTSAVSSFL